MLQGVWGERRQQGRRGNNLDQLEGGNRLVRTSHYLLLVDSLGKAHLDKAQTELRGLREMVQLGKELGLRVAVLGHLLVETAQGTAQELRDQRGTAQELLVPEDIVQVSQDRVGNYQVLKVDLDIALVLQDQRGMGTALVHLGQMIHQRSHTEQRAVLELRGLNRAILGLKVLEGCWRGLMGLCFLFF